MTILNVKRQSLFAKEASRSVSSNRLSHGGAKLVPILPSGLSRRKIQVSSHFNVKGRPPDWDNTTNHEDATVSSQRMISASTTNGIPASAVKQKSVLPKASSLAELVDGDIALPSAHLPPDQSKRYRLLQCPMPARNSNVPISRLHTILGHRNSKVCISQRSRYTG